jgi:eukaryotic-like serine/threonine-protein kinase
MALAKGTKLGPYEIVAPLGAGGMGEVYRARDTKLNRDVALKVLPETFAKDAERLARFRREAQVLASLNHPNIAAIYGLEESNGVLALVMELVEGPTLAERVEPGGLPLDEALPIARQIAEALEAAHEKGIAHRDLKPANVKVTPEGKVKVLDFGLAKPVEAGLSRQREDGGMKPPLQDSPTISAMATRAGAILGTASYMSPEQARGKPVDKRTDIWSFGCVLYEALTGRQAFAAETVSDTIAAILGPDPEWQALPAETPANIRVLLRRCLQKDVTRRLRDIGDARIEIEEALDPSRAIPGTGAVLVEPRSARRVVPLLALVAAVAIGVLAGRRLFRTEAPQPKFTAVTFRRGTVFNARFSPDGNSIYYAAAWDGNPVDIYVAGRDDPGARSLGVSGDPLLAVSRKGELAILTHALYLYHTSYVGTLALLPPSGGSPRELLENVREADFAPDGETLAVVRAERGKNVLEYPAGHVLYETPGWISYLRISPDGNRVAFLDHSIIADDRGDVAVVDRNGKTTVLSHDWAGEAGLAWSPGGKEVWFTATISGSGLALRAVTLDGKERPVLTIPGQMRVLDMARDGRALISCATSRHGIIALVEGEKRERDLSWLESSGSVRISDDGKLIAFVDESEPNGPYYAACIRKTDGSPVVRLGEGLVLALSHDARWVLTVKQAAPPQLVMLPVGAGQPKILPRGNLVAYQQYVGWSHDGKRLVFTGSEAGSGNRVYVQEVAGGDPRPISPEGYGTFSRSIAMDDRSLVVAAPDGALVRMPVVGGTTASIPGTEAGDLLVGWASDGKRIFVYHPAELRPRIFTVDLGDGERRLWKQIEPADPVGLMPFRLAFADLTPDGRNIAYQYNRFVGELYVAEGIR